METTTVPAPAPAMTQEQMIAEIHKFTKQTRNYMRWQMYITIILVVIPLLASIFILPFAFRSLENAYLQPLQGDTSNPQSIQGLFQGLQ